MNPTSSGYADVNGIKLYHEIYGQGEPLVLIHRGLTTIGEMQGWVELLAKTRQVIAVEMQGHGRTADTDRPMTFRTMGDDIAALLDDFNSESRPGRGPSRPFVRRRQCDPHGDSASGQGPAAGGDLVALCQGRLASRGSERHEPGRRVDGGKHDADADGQVLEAGLSRNAPQFLDKFGKMMSEDYDWSAEIAKLPMPVLLVFADNDSISQKHIAEFFALLGGGVKEPGWLNTQLSKSRLAVVPGYSHYNFITSPEVPQIVGKLLADPLTYPSTGAAAASQAASDLRKS